MDERNRKRRSFSWLLAACAFVLTCAVTMTLVGTKSVHVFGRAHAAEPAAALLRAPSAPLSNPSAAPSVRKTSAGEQELAPPLAASAEQGAEVLASALSAEEYRGGADEVAAFESANLPKEGGVPIHDEGEFYSPFANPSAPVTHVSVGLLLTDVPDYDIVHGTFKGGFYLSLTSKTPMPKVRLTFTNAIEVDQEIMADLATFKLYRVRGEFVSLPDIHKYPFDTQELSIEVEDVYNGTDMIRFAADEEHTFVDAGFSIAGWDVSYLRARTMAHSYPGRFEKDDLYYHRYTFALGIQRFATSAMFTVFVPALVIVLISLAGLWFPRKNIDVRTNATTPMLAAAVLFHFALTQSLPSVAYLTRADKLMLAVYLCLGLHMSTVWAWFLFDEKHTELIFKWGKRVAVPVTFVFMALGILM